MEVTFTLYASPPETPVELVSDVFSDQILLVEFNTRASVYSTTM